MSGLHNVRAPGQDVYVSKASPISSGKHSLLSASYLSSLPKMPSLIDGILPSSGLACVYGPSGAGKSFICLDMAAKVASGMNWFGHPTKQSRVVYIALEGQAGLSNRIAAWEKHHGVPFPEDVKFVVSPVAINKPDDVLNVVDLIKLWGEQI